VVEAIDIQQEIEATLQMLEQKVRTENKNDDSRYRIAKSNLRRFSNFIEEERPKRYFVERPTELRETIYEFIIQDENKISSTYLRPFKTLIENIEPKYSGENKRNLKMIRDWVRAENFSVNEDRSSVTFFDENQLDALFDAATPMESAEIQLFIDTGIKAGVAATLTKEDLSESSLNVKKQFKQGEGVVSLPDYRKRPIPIDRELREKFQGIGSDSDYLFGESPLGSKRNLMRWSNLQEEVGFEIKTEYLRNTCAVRKLRQGVPPESVAEIYLGQKDMNKIKRINSSI
jgi:integrase